MCEKYICKIIFNKVIFYIPRIIFEPVRINYIQKLYFMCEKYICKIIFDKIILYMYRIIFET